MGTIRTLEDARSRREDRTKMVPTSARMNDILKALEEQMGIREFDLDAPQAVADAYDLLLWAADIAWTWRDAASLAAVLRTVRIANYVAVEVYGPDDSEEACAEECSED